MSLHVTIPHHRSATSYMKTISSLHSLSLPAGKVIINNKEDEKETYRVLAAARSVHIAENRLPTLIIFMTVVENSRIHNDNSLAKNRLS